MSSALSYGVGFVIILTTGILYERWKKKDALQKQIDDYEYVRKYLLTESTLAKVEKPILWVPLHFEYNASTWQ